jgi:protein-L-isoaspartate(D-aspartate) O-methyltransferase
MGPREAMIAALESDARETGALTGRPVLSPPVLAAMRAVPRDAFVPEARQERPLLHRPLPIGHGQTISQPFIVALMTELLDLAPGARVLEIGTGSGYQAAVLAALGAEVFSIETIPALAERAREALTRAGFPQVRVRQGDGAAGWPEAAPFDAVIVTAAARAVPPALVAQLRPGGRMVIPLGEPGGEQTLTLVSKSVSGEASERPLLPVAFVPFTGAPGAG